jgi:hypothetical protein
MVRHVWKLDRLEKHVTLRNADNATPANKSAGHDCLSQYIGHLGTHTGCSTRGSTVGGPAHDKSPLALTNLKQPDIVVAERNADGAYFRVESRYRQTHLCNPREMK